VDKSSPLVKVVTSVFNGEQYIREQVESVLKQTYSNFELYIRDNCSTDRTLDVLQEYASNPKIHIIKGDENLGVVLGYFTLLELCGDADYYAFCDSDDVWEENKVEVAVGKLEQTDGQIPVLYCSGYDICDENLSYIRQSPRIRNISFRNCLVDVIAPSSTYVFNEAAREIIIQNIPSHATFQDRWILMMCQGLGEIIFDPRPLMKYRRHGKSSTPSTQSKIKLTIWRIKYFLVDGKTKGIREEIQEYSDMFANQLCEEDQKVLQLFTRRNVGTALKKVFYPKLFRQTFSDEIMLRGLFLLGVL